MSSWDIITTPFCILPYISLYTCRVSCTPANLLKCYCSEDSHHREAPIHEPSSKSRCINGSIARRLSCICCGLRRFTWSIIPTSNRISYSYCRTLNERARSRQQKPTLTFLCVCVCVCKVCRPKWLRIEFVWERLVQAAMWIWVRQFRN
jgi:hypothetical protein